MIRWLPSAPKQNTEHNLLSLLINQEKNEVLFKLYQILEDSMCYREGHVPKESISYEEITRIFNKTYGASNRHSANKHKQLKSCDISTYTKKMEKLGFLQTDAIKDHKEVKLQVMQAYHKSLKAKHSDVWTQALHTLHGGSRASKSVNLTGFQVSKNVVAHPECEHSCER